MFFSWHVMAAMGHIHFVGGMLHFFHMFNVLSSLFVVNVFHVGRFAIHGAAIHGAVHRFVDRFILGVRVVDIPAVHGFIHGFVLGFLALIGLLRAIVFICNHLAFIDVCITDARIAFLLLFSIVIVLI
jgi:hypothetical protein